MTILGIAALLIGYLPPPIQGGHELSPDQARRQAHRAFVSGRFAEAERLLAPLDRAGDWYAALLLGEIAELRGDWNLALRRYREAAARAPDRPEPAQELARLEALRREAVTFVEARRRIRRDCAVAIALFATLLAGAWALAGKGAGAVR